MVSLKLLFKSEYIFQTLIPESWKFVKEKGRKYGVRGWEAATHTGVVAYYTLNDISDCNFWILESSPYFLA